MTLQLQRFQNSGTNRRKNENHDSAGINDRPRKNFAWYFLKLYAKLPASVIKKAIFNFH